MTDQDTTVHGLEAARWGGWDWREPSRGEHFRRCNYCGSIHPDDLVAEPAWRAEWADQKYGWPHKFYVNIPNRDPDALYVVGQANHKPASHPAYPWFDSTQLTAQQEAAMERDGYAPGSRYRREYVQFGTRTHHFAKFYTVHLKDSAITAETKAAIEQRCGLSFVFDSGFVRWTPTDATQQADVRPGGGD